LEYGCHVGDAFRIGVLRLQRLLNEDNPTFDNWDQDETAAADRYGGQDPSVVADELVAAGNARRA